MITGDMDLHQFPPWIWPYIRTSELAKSHLFEAEEGLPDRMPEVALLGQFVSIVQAVQLKVIAGRLGSAGDALAKSASTALSELVDDYCGTKPRPPFPWPPRSAKLATYVAVFAASTTDERLKSELGGVVETLSSRGR